MKDFNPANLVEQIPQLQKLMALREALVALKGPLGNTPSFRNAIERTLANGDSAHECSPNWGWIGPKPDIFSKGH